MKYRSDYMNRETHTNKIRALSKDQIQQAMEGCKYIRDVLRKIGLPSQGYLGSLLKTTMEEHGFDMSRFAVKRRVNLTGQRFGHLVVLNVGPTLKCGNTTWICREEETGIEKPVLTKHLLKGSSRSFSFAARRGDSHHQWSGCGQISGSYWNSVCRHALSRKLTFEITIEHAWKLYLAQGRLCALSGEPIYFGESNTCPYTASLDRIDSHKGYTSDNVQWVHGKINIMKNRYSQGEFIDFCRKVALKHAA